MLRANWFVVVAVLMNCQSLILAANTEQPEDDTQQILIRSKLIEINRTKLRQLGVDFAGVLGDGTVTSAKLDKAKLTDIVFRLDAVKESPIAAPSFMGLLDAMCQNKVARILSEPTITTVAGRNAEISSGSSIKVDIPPDNEETSASIFVGTKLEVEPHLVANNKIRIEYRIDHSTLGEKKASELRGSPRVERTSVDTTIEVSPGETFVGGGLMKKVHTGDKVEHFEVVLLVTPELVDGVELKK